MLADISPHPFPLLENLTLVGVAISINGDESDMPCTLAPSSTSTALTWTFEFRMAGGSAEIECRLLDLPDGHRFRELKFGWCAEGDLRSGGHSLFRHL